MARVIVYGSDACGACKETVNFLRKKGVKFEYRDALKYSKELHPIYKKRCEKEGKCEIAIPLIKIGDKIIVGFNAKELEKEL